MVRVGPILLLFLLSACSATGDPGSSEGNPPEAQEPRDLRVERLAAGAPGEGPESPRVVAAPSAAALSKAVDAEIPDSGRGTYLLAYSGERPTGGFSVDVADARIEGDKVILRLTLEGPPSDAIVTQALTYPYVLALVRGLEPRGKEFSFVDGEGRELGWPVRRVGG
jgi:hypothetical protein